MFDRKMFIALFFTGFVFCDLLIPTVVGLPEGDLELPHISSIKARLAESFHKPLTSSTRENINKLNKFDNPYRKAFVDSLPIQPQAVTPNEDDTPSLSDSQPNITETDLDESRPEFDKSSYDAILTSLKAEMPKIATRNRNVKPKGTKVLPTASRTDEDKNMTVRDRVKKIENRNKPMGRVQVKDQNKLKTIPTETDPSEYPVQKKINLYEEKITNNMKKSEQFCK
ncbi:uncharacterized protein LOC116351367 [Contarinia nasturtii]|uniref:uncharacterized protein LOC116351367 n=1 Tax=Contarinia nasturtii TaxID=265458 RepID=UPI0012D3A150|nr:uncharacterized protein LOC116351367 [Contarinia nasturtii]